MSPIQVQILMALQFLGTPMGILAIAGFILLLAITLIVPQIKWALLVTTIIATSLSVTDPTMGKMLIFPLEQMRAQARPTTIAFLLLLLVALLRSPEGTRRKYVLAGAAWFFVFELFTGVRLLAGGLVSRGGPEIIIFGIVFLTLVLALARSVSNWNDCMSLVRTLAWTGVIFAVLNFLQLLAHPGASLQNGRFQGTTGNPQHFAAHAALLMLPVLYFLIRSGRSRFGRIGMAFGFAILLAMLLWTASRTGLLMAVVGIALLFRTRLSRFAVAGIVVGALVLLVLNFTTEISGSQVLFGRLISTQDTRTQVWSSLISQFLRNPVIGYLPTNEISIGENSYLSTAARFGLLGLVPLTIAMILIGKAMVRLQRVSHSLPDKMLADLVIAGIAQVFVGGFFEGYLIGTLSVEPFVIFIYLVVAGFLLEYAEVSRPEQISEEQLPEFVELYPGGI